MSTHYGSVAMADKFACFAGAPASSSQQPKAADVVTERHYSPQELAELWNLSVKTIRSMFWDEPGVLKFGSSRYLTLRIPESVALRVHQKRSR